MTIGNTKSTLINIWSFYPVCICMKIHVNYSDALHQFSCANMPLYKSTEPK